MMSGQAVPTTDDMSIGRIMVDYFHQIGRKMADNIDYYYQTSMQMTADTTDLIRMLVDTLNYNLIGLLTADMVTDCMVSSVHMVDVDYLAVDSYQTVVLDNTPKIIFL